MFTVNPSDMIPIPRLMKIHYTLLGCNLTRTHGYDKNPIPFFSIRNEEILLPVNDHHLYCGMVLSSCVVCTSQITRFVNTISYHFHKVTQLSIPTHAQLHRHRLKFIKITQKTTTCFGLRPTSGSYNVLVKIAIIIDHSWMFLC